MIFRKLLFLICLVFTAFSASGALSFFNTFPPDTLSLSDSIIYDTVIVTKDPVFVKKEIKVDDPASVVYLSFGLYAGPCLSLNLNKPRHSDNRDYYDITKNTVRNNSGYTIGGNWIFFNRNWRLEIGAALSIFNNDFNYSGSRTLRDTSIQMHTDTIDVYYIVNPDSSLTPVYTTQNQQQRHIDSTLETKKYTDRSHSFLLEIPVLLGYEMAFKKIYFTPKAGVIAGFTINGKGLAVSRSDYFFTEDLLPLKRKIMIFLFASANIAWDATKRYRLYAEPYFRFNVLETYIHSFPLKSHMAAYGLKLGIIYNL
jgi:hypothetical protein